MIEVKRTDDFTPNHAIPYMEAAKATMLLKTLLVAKEQAQKAIKINIGTLCVAAERQEEPPEQLITLSDANVAIDENLREAIFQVLALDESFPNKYNKVAALLEEFDIHGIDKVFDSLIDLSFIEGDIQEEEK